LFTIIFLSSLVDCICNEEMSIEGVGRHDPSSIPFDTRARVSELNGAEVTRLHALLGEAIGAGAHGGVFQCVMHF
jgi:hypothetical protein